MGGFFKSKDLKRILREWEDQYYFPEGVTDEVYDALEQCIVMTKTIEDGDMNELEYWHSKFSPDSRPTGWASDFSDKK